jgi:hypothetical protein
MIASRQTLPALYTPEINVQGIDFPIKQSEQILISEKEYLELKL